MKKINSATALLVALELVVVILSLWIVVRNVAKRGDFERITVNLVFVLSALTLLVSSIILREKYPLLTLVAWLTLFSIMIIALLFPRL